MVMETGTQVSLRMEHVGEGEILLLLDGWRGWVCVKVETGETGPWGDDVGKTGALGIGSVCE